MASDLTYLHRKRGAVKAKLTIFVTFLNAIQGDEATDPLEQTSINELRLRVDCIEGLLQEFDEVQLAIDCACGEEEIERETEARNEFTNLFLSTLAKAKTFYEKCVSSENTDAQSQHSGSVYSRNVQSNSNVIQGVKLPTIHLPKFKGSYDNWMEFKDTFDSLIHSNNSITNIQKFHYLRASLEGDALKVIQSLEFSADNYTNAWQLLCDRYNNSRLLVNNHLKALFEIEPIQKETCQSLRNLVDTISKNLRALETLEQPIEHWDTLIIFMVANKLDKNSSREWEKLKSNNNFPTLAEFREFLINRADWLETLEVNYAAKGPKESKGQGASKPKWSSNASPKNISLFSSKGKKCNFCKGDHLIYGCKQFLELEVATRLQKVDELKLCRNCLCTGHVVEECKSGPCKKCSNRHNSLLHQSTQVENNSQISLSALSRSTCVLLSTAEVIVCDSNGQESIARVLLDCGSQSNYISERLCSKLNLEKQDANVNLVGINMTSSNVKKKVSLKIRSKSNRANFTKTICCLVLPKISDDLPLCEFDIDAWKIPSGIDLADERFNTPSEIDILIGAELFWQLLREGNIRLGKNLPTIQNTAFGWIVTGSINKQLSTTICNFSRLSDLDASIRQFWEIEEYNPTETKSSDEDLCEEHFTHNLSRSEDGQFIVRLPFKHPPSLLGDSKSIATKRFLQLEKRFKTDSDLYNQYSEFMKEYIHLGHMSPDSSSESDANNHSYFMPHHGVIRHDSLTTKLRVVFNGSAVTESGISLNDLLFTGPTIISDLFEILIRFRQQNVVVCADIAKMYRQIQVHPDDRQFQKILWRQSPDERLIAYELNTVTYGTSSAPYLAIRCLKQVAIDVKDDCPKSSSIIENDFYVDDLITGFSSEEEAIATCKEVSKILEAYNFPLRKWISNKSEILRAMKTDEDPLTVINIGKNSQMKTLGIQWIPDADVLTYNIKCLPENVECTKRTILSSIATIFDPLGLVGPCILLVKILVQQLWSLQIGWDDSIPRDLENKWLKFRDELVTLNQLRVPRHSLSSNSVSVELHGFSDASQQGYGVCIYLRCRDECQNVNIHLLCAKTRVSPLKVLTIPRLELCSAVMLAHLITRVRQSLTIVGTVHLWCDSQIVLCWIKTNPRLLQTFVSNRIADIQRLTDAYDWNYINSKDNPADLASRGAYPNTLIGSELWWNGPSWMMLPHSAWPLSTKEVLVTNIPEMKQESSALANCVVDNASNFNFNRFSSLTRLKRVMSYCLRFLINLKSMKHQRQLKPLSVEELSSGMRRLIWLAQQESFSNEISVLRSSATLNSKNKLLGLFPFLDDTGLLRVGGRLKYSQLQYKSKHPILLSGKHYLTKLIFEHYHRSLCHAPPQLLLTSVRQEYWPTSGISIAKRVVRNCVRCFKFNPKSVQPIMADLPKERVTAMNPFNMSGVDYAGPFFVKDRKGRGSKVTKAYLCLFICFSVKAVHLELVSDLTTECFIAALRRFASRRGKPAHIYSDNGTNFVGAHRELTLLNKFLIDSNDVILECCANEGISWHFIPPNSPHFGGLWESNVKSVKHHLLRVLGDVKLTYEELNTLIIQVEGIVNSRPLHALSADPNDYAPLSPSHFLIGRSLLAVPDPSLQEVPMNKLSRFQLIQQLNQGFWKRWLRDYFGQLQQRTKWKNPCANVSIDTLVLLQHDNSLPCSWPLGRIVAIHPDENGVVRVVTVKTAKGLFKRAVKKVCPLPISEDNSERL